MSAGGTARRRARQATPRPHRVGIKFSDEEYGLVSAAAEAVGLSVAAFVALAAVTGRVPGSDPGIQPGLLRIPDRRWQPVGEDNDPWAQMHAPVVTEGGVCLHVDAVAVTSDAGEQLVAPGAVYDTDDLDAVRAAAGADGPFTTATIAGREYVLIATPYC